MRDSVMWFLVAALVMTALMVVKTRHQHRIAYLELHSEQLKNDGLNDEWGQLLIEENVYGFPHSVEKNAHSELAMRAPTPEDIEFVGLENDQHELAVEQKQRTEVDNGAR